MRVVITGGSGLIGRALTEDLTRDGHAVVVLSRSPERVRGLPPGAQVVAWDAKTGHGWAQHADGADAIVNLAGASLKGEGFLPSRWTARRKRLIRDSRLQSGAAVVDAVRQAQNKPKLVIQSSAVGYYGPQGDQALDEAAPAGQDFLADVCVEWEASTADVEALGLRRVIVRTGLPLAVEGGAFPLLRLPFQLFAGNTFGDGAQYYSWVHFGDFIRALRFLIEHDAAQGIYNLTAPNPVTNQVFAKTLGAVMRRPLWLPAPALALNLALGEVSTVVLDGQRALPQHLQADGFTFEYPELEPALRDLLT